MDDLTQLKSNLDTTESQLSQYTSELPSQMEAQIQKAYSPALDKSLGVTKDLMSDYLGRYFDVTTMGPGMAGTTAKDLSPTQKLGVMGRELGTMSGNLNAASAYSDYLGGQMNDMYGKALQAAQMGQQNLADQYSRQMQQYQLAWQAAEAEKDRAFQREMARLSGGGGSGGISITYPEQAVNDELIIDTGEPEIMEPKKQSLTDRVVSSVSSRVPSTPKWTDYAKIGPLFTGATLVGNYLGNRKQEDMSFWDKLFNRR